MAVHIHHRNLNFIVSLGAKNTYDPFEHLDFTHLGLRFLGVWCPLIQSFVACNPCLTTCVPLLSPILAVLVTQTLTLHNGRQMPVHVCLLCLSSGVMRFASVQNLRYSGIYTQASSDVPKTGVCSKVFSERKLFPSVVRRDNLVESLAGFAIELGITTPSQLPSGQLRVIQR